MITAEMIKTLDDRTLKWYRKRIEQFHQSCLREYDRCYPGGDSQRIFHNHFKELEKMLTDEINCRKKEYERMRAELYTERLSSMLADYEAFSIEHPDRKNAELEAMNERLALACKKSRIYVDEEHVLEWRRLIYEAHALLEKVKEDDEGECLKRLRSDSVAFEKDVKDN